MTEFGPSETYSPTSNDLFLLLSSQHLQNAFPYGTIAQTASDIQDVQNSPAISMGPYLIISGQTELLRSISVYSERGKSREQVRLLYMNTEALGIWRAMGKRTHIIGAQKRPPRTAHLAYGFPLANSRHPRNALRLSDCRSCTFLIWRSKSPSQP
jgi:hypothetical protein